jgi:hypothetical protein
MNLEELVEAIADAVVHVDNSRIPFRSFQPGAGPYGEPQLVKLIAAYLAERPAFHGAVVPKRTPDLPIRNEWFVPIL